MLVHDIQLDVMENSNFFSFQTYPKIDTGSGCLSKGTFVTSSSDDTIRIWNTDPHMPSDMPLKRNIYSHVSEPCGLYVLGLSLGGSTDVMNL